MSAPLRGNITAVAKYHPERVITNEDLSKHVQTSDEWIKTRTGISTRRRVKKGQASSDLAISAIESLFKKKQIQASEIDLIIVATVTPDMMFPSTACIIQDKIKAKNAWGFDLSGACSGFLFALNTADQFIRAGKHQCILVVGVDVMSSIVDPLDRTTCVLFGDGCGVALVEPEPQTSHIGIIDSINRCDGSGGPLLCMPAGGSLNPASHETVEQRLHFAKQEGQSVFKQAVSQMSNVSHEILEKNGFSPKDVDLFVPHQANLRIIESCQKKLGLKDEQIVINIDKYANTTAATIPTCLHQAVADGRLTKGKLVLMASFGAGFTWGATLIRWGY